MSIVSEITLKFLGSVPFLITKNKLYVQAGGGVVYDSDPELEYMETVNKAKAVLNAAEIVLGNNL